MEALTDRMEELAYEYFHKIDELGGMVEAVKRGYPQREIADAAFELQHEIDSGLRTVVGVNRFTEGDEQATEILRIDPDLERQQIERVRATRSGRDAAVVKATLAAITDRCQDRDHELDAAADRGCARPCLRRRDRGSAAVGLG